jgi:hypothetical protein
MCTQFTNLAESNDHRYISQCEHGTIYLTWDLMTLYLNLSEFVQLVQLLKRGPQMTEPTKLSEDQGVVIYKKQGFYQLWWRNLAIKFSRADFLTFVTMSQVALHMVHEREVTNLLLQ